MRENYINDYTLTVGGGGITNVATSLPVSAAASVASGFRILIDSELMLVTAGATTTTWTVTRGIESTTAALHIASTTIDVVLSAGSLDQIRSDISGIGTYANLPSSNMKMGDLYSCTDSPYRFVYDGSAWQAFFRDINVTLPPSSTTGWSWTNQGGASVTLTKGLWVFTDPPIGGGDNIRLFTKARPHSTPWTTITGIQFNHFVANYPFGGAAAYTTSGTFFLVGTNYSSNIGGYVRSMSGTNVNSISGGTSQPFTFGDLLFIKIQDDGSHLTTWVSTDSYTWSQIGSSYATGSLLVGFFTNAENSTWALNYNVFHYQEI